MKALRLPEKDIRRVEDFLKSSGFKRREVRNTLWSYEGEDIYFNMYPSGTLLIQGKEADEWVEKILSVVDNLRFPVGGCDEVGKGDIFGPLVLCCAVITPENFKKVLLLNPKDSKLLKDEEVLKKAKELRKLVKVKCITLMPERFNELYESYKNINRLMDDAYRKLVRVVLSEFKLNKVVVDRYSSRDPFGDVKEVEFIEKGERDVAVSVASIMAREKFLRRLKELEERFGIEVPKGASGEVKHRAKELLKKDPSLARKVLKLSFLE